MSNRPPALRALALLLGGLLLLAAGFGAQRNLHVCKASGVVAAVGAERECCVADAGRSCCKAGECRCAGKTHQPQPREESPQSPASKDGGCDSECCVAVAVHVDNGPLPRNLEVDQDAPLCALLPPNTASMSGEPTSRILPTATRPPRDDPGAALRRTVQLLI